jgi:hypothetical protein
VICPTARGVYQPAGDAGDEQLVIDEQLYGGVELLFAVSEHPVELFGLGDRPRESIKDEPTSSMENCINATGCTDPSVCAHSPVPAGLVVFQLVFDHPHHDVVADETTGIHDFLRLHTERRLLGDLFAQHVAGGEMAHAELVANLGGLRAFTWT